jgi:hypothetical protein
MFDEIKAYFKTWIRLLKLEAIDTGSSLIAAFIVDLLLIVVFIFALIFFSAALAALAAHLLHSKSAGTACVAGLYVLVAICVPLCRKPFQNLLIRYLLKKIDNHRKNNGNKQ